MKIAGSQLKAVFGVRVSAQPSIFHTIYYNFKRAFVDYEINWAAFVVWLIATLLLLVVQKLNARFKPRIPIPGPLIVVIIGTLISYLADLNTPIVGTLPSIFPKPVCVFVCVWLLLLSLLLFVWDFLY